MPLIQQIAEHLHWTIEQVQGFSFQTLRDIVKDKHLKALLNEQIISGNYIRGERWVPKRPVFEPPVWVERNDNDEH